MIPVDTVRAAGPLLADGQVRASFLDSSHRFPVVLRPAAWDVDLPALCGANRAAIDALLAQHGAILFRDFGLTIRDFEATARAAAGDLFADYGDLPRNRAGENIYESTPYPPDAMILFHNESAHLASWPMRISFHCVVPPQAGGCTPVLDVRAIVDALDRAVVATFREKGLLYVRNFSAGIDPTWQAFFHTDDRATVERMCREAGSTFDWRPDGSLRVSRRADAVRAHPDTGEAVFFNQIQHHHLACLDEETREGMRALFDEGDFPRAVYYGDGTPIPDEVMAHVGETYERNALRFAWQRGDMLMLDNMLVAHARDPYEPPRQIVVAMGRMHGSA